MLRQCPSHRETKYAYAIFLLPFSFGLTFEFWQSLSLKKRGAHPKCKRHGTPPPPAAHDVHAASDSAPLGGALSAKHDITLYHGTSGKNNHPQTLEDFQFIDLSMQAKRSDFSSKGDYWKNDPVCYWCEIEHFQVHFTSLIGFERQDSMCAIGWTMRKTPLS